MCYILRYDDIIDTFNKKLHNPPLSYLIVLKFLIEGSRQFTRANCTWKKEHLFVSMFCCHAVL